MAGKTGIEVTKHLTTITLVNYERFQNPAANHTTNRQQGSSQPATDQQQGGIYNKGNKGNKGKNISGADEADVQTPEEIAEALRWFESL